MYQARYAVESVGYREKRSQRSKRWYALNREKGKSTSAAYYQKHRATLAIKKRCYNHTNLERWRIIDANRRLNDIEFRIKKTLRARIGSAIKRNTKTGSAIDTLGCSISGLKLWLEQQFHSGMTWDNWPKFWQIDHVRALSSFDLLEDNQFRQACHYTNLQPLLTEDHRLKSADDVRRLRFIGRS